jgi:AraC family transcriptional regulator of adaptative response / DNA-3-methyladenine glycosylase II
VPPDPEQSWRAVEAQDARFDGWIYCGVTSTGIYCRPSCPARTPKRENVRFFTTAAAAQAAGFRACKRCRPDATPGSPEWDRRADVAGRAMRLIAGGVVDREGVAGLASRLGYSERHLHRRLVEVVGVGPLALARARRAQTARTLLELTDLPITGVAFAAGFSSVRQFNATIREVFALAPRELRAHGRRTRARAAGDGSGAVTLRLPYRAPLAARELLAFLALRAVAGVEELDGDTYRRSLRLPHGAGVVALTPRDGHVEARLQLDDLRDLATAAQRCRELLDLDSDPHTVAATLGADPVLGGLVRQAPGRRVPGHVDGAELAVRAVIGQQVSVAGARTVAGTLTRRFGEPLEHPVGGITHRFPSPERLAELTPEQAPMPASRARTIAGLARALAGGDVTLDAGADPHETRERLLALPGVGPWTADYIAMRALRDPDAFLPTDLGVRRAIEALGHPGDPRAIARRAEAWRPYRAYATLHLWALEAAPANVADLSAA